jgi:hypothetical protein
MDSTLMAAIVTGILTIVSTIAAVWYAHYLSERKSSQAVDKVQQGYPTHSFSTPRETARNELLDNAPIIYHRKSFAGFLGDFCVVTIVAISFTAIMSFIVPSINGPSYPFLIAAVFLYLLIAQWVSPWHLLSLRYLALWAFFVMFLIYMSGFSTFTYLRDSLVFLYVCMFIIGLVFTGLLIRVGMWLKKQRNIKVGSE